METSSVTFPMFFQDSLTSLHIAAHDDLLEIVTILLAGGANPNIQNMVGKRSHMSVYKIYGNIFGQSENGNFTYFSHQYHVPVSTFVSIPRLTYIQGPKIRDPQNHTNITQVKRHSSHHHHRHSPAPVS